MSVFKTWFGGAPSPEAEVSREVANGGIEPPIRELIEYIKENDIEVEREFYSISELFDVKTKDFSLYATRGSQILEYNFSTVELYYHHRENGDDMYRVKLSEEEIDFLFKELTEIYFSRLRDKTKGEDCIAREGIMNAILGESNGSDS